MTSNNDLFTYGYDDGLIRIYIEGQVVFSFNEHSPILDMFESLIDMINEDL